MAVEPGVEIVNAALFHLGADPIAALDPTEDTMAGQLAARYPRIRDAVLRRYPWNFAERFATLPAATLAAPLFGFVHRATLPSGPEAEDYCLRVLSVDTREPWAVKGRDLYHAAAPPLTIRYIARIDDPNAMDALCFELIAGELALAMSNRIGTSEARKRRNDLRSMMVDLRREARRVDALEQSAPKLAGGVTPSWIAPRARRAGR